MTATETSHITLFLSLLLTSKDPAQGWQPAESGRFEYASKWGRGSRPKCLILTRVFFSLLSLPTSLSPAWSSQSFAIR
jgi:hypothetical protein